MTTSGVTTWALTARDVVTAALEDNAIIALGREPKAREMEACVRRLNGMLKCWQSQGALWLEGTETVTVPAGEASVQLGSGILNVTGARMVQGPTYQRQLAVWDRDDYFVLPNKASTGSPTAIYPDRELAGVALYVFPVPFEDAEIVLDVMRGVETVTDPSQTLDFPEEYQEAVYTNLAVRIAGLFGSQAPQELIARAAVLERQMLDAQRPASYFMGAYA